MALPPAIFDDLHRVPPQGLAARVVQRHSERGRRAAICLDGWSPQTPAAARAFIRQAAAAWRLPRPQTQDLVQIVSELATNAVEHTHSQTITVTAAVIPGAAVVSVTDRGPHKPLAVPAADDRAEHGRGLHIVDTLSQTWGHLHTGTGTRVWARVALPLGAVPCRQPATGGTA
ncbi:MAG: ATP-binding protein [Streptomycetaceae bacterium]|nr:ATP-binding protein [Streptomycetaceae bacterium]